MEKFNFMNGEEFRNSLESDYNELNECIKVNAWKAMHVLAGSIIEALLIDSLVTYDNKKASLDILKMDLGQAIVECRKKGILTEKTEQLSRVIKSYRNLIHPGRKVRLSEEVDEDSAKVAKALVDMVIKEVSATRKANYGYTAEQIVSKLERDSSAISILEPILKETNHLELERLLLFLIPKRYNELKKEDDAPSNVFNSLENCFRVTLSLVNDEIKKKVMEKFVLILKEEDEAIVFSYETAFLKGQDLKFLSVTDSAIVKKHLLSRLSKEDSVKLFQALKYVGKYLTSEDIVSFVDSVVKHIINGEEDKIRSISKDFLIEEYSNMKSSVKASVIKRIDDWIPHLEKNNFQYDADTLRNIKVELEF
jgi:hypothetical protein